MIQNITANPKSKRITTHRNRILSHITQNGGIIDNPVLGTANHGCQHQQSGRKTPAVTKEGG